VSSDVWHWQQQPLKQLPNVLSYCPGMVPAQDTSGCGFSCCECFKACSWHVVFFRVIIICHVTHCCGFMLFAPSDAALSGVQKISIDSCMAGAQQQPHCSSGMRWLNVGSATLSAGVGS